jgi:hypothetical protein
VKHFRHLQKHFVLGLGHDESAEGFAGAPRFGNVGRIPVEERVRTILGTNGLDRRTIEDHHALESSMHRWQSLDGVQPRGCLSTVVTAHLIPDPLSGDSFAFKRRRGDRL